MKQFKELRERFDPAEYVVGSEKSKFGGYRAEVKNKKTGKVMYLGSVGWKSPKHAEAHAQAYLDGYARGGDRGAQNKSADFINKNSSKTVNKESVDEALGNDNPSHRGKPKMDKDGTVHNIPGKKGGLSAYTIKPRLDGKTLMFGTVDQEGNIKVMTVQELAKVLK